MTRLLIWAVLFTGILISVQIGNVGLAFFLGLLFVADLLGGIIGKVISGVWGAGEAILESTKTDAEEVSKVKTKPPDGYKMASEGFSNIGKAIGKGEKNKAAGKKTKSKLGIASIVDSIEHLMKGIGKLFNR